MRPEAKDILPVVVHRVACHARSRRAAQWLELADRGDFKPGERVYALRPVKNDGVYPHKDIGEVLVREGDTGITRERWSFLGEVYYAVEFVAGAVVVIMRGREMQRVACRGGQSSGSRLS